MKIETELEKLCIEFDSKLKAYFSDRDFDVSFELLEVSISSTEINLQEEKMHMDNSSTNKKDKQKCRKNRHGQIVCTPA
jgi:hypothetical protein